MIIMIMMAPKGSQDVVRRRRSCKSYGPYGEQTQNHKQRVVPNKDHP